MASRHEKLLEEFESFEADLEIEEILKKVKEELVLDPGVTDFGEQLKERERMKSSLDNQSSTSHPLATTVLPATHVFVVH